MTNKRRNAMIMAALVFILLFAAIAIIKYNASYSTKQYSREDVAVVITNNSQNERITMLFLPDNNTIIISGETGMDEIYQSTGAPIFLQNNKLGVKLRDGWAIKYSDSKWYFDPNSEEYGVSQERYGFNDVEVLGNGTIILLPGNTVVKSLPEEYKTVIILNSTVKVERNNIDESLTVQFPDGWIYKAKNGNWSKLNNP